MAARATSGTLQYRFSDTNGYGGLMMLCMALDSRVRMWLVPGDRVGGTGMKIPVESRSTRKGYTDYETYDLDLADDLLRVLRDPSSSGVILAPVSTLICPTSPNGQAFNYLKECLPLEYVPARVEGSPYDCTVDGLRWQLKLAWFDHVNDRYHANAVKQCGRFPGGRRHCQYAAVDFEWFCVQLPPELQAAYLIPMTTLVARGLADRADCGGATVHVYPHRRVRSDDWTDAYMIDLCDPLAALADYRRICASHGGSVM